jgi:ABC-2 type transport system permease protein
MSSKLVKIARMEFKLTAANKAFIIITILGPFLIFAMTVLPSLLMQKGGFGGPRQKVAMIGASPEFIQGIEPALKGLGVDLMRPDSSSPESLDDLVLSGGLNGYLIIPQDLAGATRLEYVTKDTADFIFIGSLQGVIGQSIVAMRLVASGLPPERIASLVQPPTIENKRLTSEGKKESQDYLTVLFTTLAFAFLIYMTVLLYGQAIGRSVLTEKTSKTVEIMLSSVRPRDLMYGKIFGKAIGGLIQYAIWIIMSLLFLKLVGPRLGVDLNLNINASTLFYLVLFFLLAFFIYCSVYAGLGAASEDEARDHFPHDSRGFHRADHHEPSIHGRRGAFDLPAHRADRHVHAGRGFERPSPADRDFHRAPASHDRGYYGALGQDLPRGAPHDGKEIQDRRGPEVAAVLRGRTARQPPSCGPRGGRSSQPLGITPS